MEKINESIRNWIETIDEFIITIDATGAIKDVNHAWEGFYGLHDLKKAPWKTGENYFEKLRSKGKEAEIGRIKKVLSTDVEDDRQLPPFQLKSSETQSMEVYVLPNQDQGAVIHHKPINLHTAQPITAETVLESMTEGFCLLDNDLQLLYINEIGEELLQCNRGNSLGRELLDLFPEASETHFLKYYLSALESQEVVEFVDYYQPLDNWFQVKVCPLKKGGLSLYFQDVSERIKTEAQLTKFAYYDYLTGLPNWKLMNKKMDELLETKKPFSIFHLNIDNLDVISAIYPRTTSETIMKKAAKELKKFTHDNCHIGRLEGHEFIILREASKQGDTDSFVKRIEKIFSKPFLLANSEEVSVSVSIGIASCPFDAQEREELLSCAHMAMSEAKKVGGSSCMFFLQNMKTMRNRMVLIEEGLKSDLKASGFYFTMQPQIDMTSGDITGVEVLSRWNHPELGFIPAMEFIQLAEDSGDILELTTHLFTELFTQIKKWEKQFGWNLRTAINLTPSLLNNPDFFDSFFALIDLHQVNPNLLELEITEQVEFTYSTKIVENLRLCKSKGISIVIDDFGTGLSMVAYLTNFPVSKIKIDKLFVEKIGQDPRAEAILKSIIHLAEGIECEFVAEGVERVEEAEFLQANNCSVFQGDLFEKPLTVKDFEAKYLIAGHNFQKEQHSGNRV